MALVKYCDTNGIPQAVDVTNGHVHILTVGDDAETGSIKIIDFPHEEIHEGNSFTAFFTRTTDADNGHRSGIYIKTPADVQIHIVAQFSGRTACIYSLCEAPTIAANTGTHDNVIYNRYRDSPNISGCLDNATVPAANRFTTLTEGEIAVDGTWNTGTLIRSAPLIAGSGPKPAGGSSRDTQE